MDLSYLRTYLSSWEQSLFTWGLTIMDLSYLRTYLSSWEQSLFTWGLKFLSVKGRPAYTPMKDRCVAIRNLQHLKVPKIAASLGLRSISLVHSLETFKVCWSPSMPTQERTVHFNGPLTVTMLLTIKNTLGQTSYSAHAKYYRILQTWVWHWRAQLELHCMNFKMIFGT